MTLMTEEQRSDLPTIPHVVSIKTILMIRILLLARVMWVPLAAYAAGAVTHIGMLYALSGPGQSWGPGVSDKLTAWDGRLLLQIAQHGYPSSFTYGADGKLTGNNLAFMPMYPALVAGLHWVSGWGYSTCGLVVSRISFLVLLVVANTLFGSLYGRRVASISTILLACAQPMGIVFLMSYTESLFVALSMAALLALHRRHWLTAGVLTSLAGLTRPVGVATSLALLIGVVTYLLWRRRFLFRPLVGAVIGFLGLPSYLFWVGLRVGVLNAWFTIQQAGWGTHWDNGRSTLRLLGDAFTKSEGWVLVSTAVLITVIATITLSSWRSVWLPLAVYGATVIVMTFGQSNYYHCKVRLLLPVIVLVIPIARTLAKAKRSTLYISIILATAFSSWYGAYMLTIWRYTI